MAPSFVNKLLDKLDGNNNSSTSSSAKGTTSTSGTDKYSSGSTTAKESDSYNTASTAAKGSDSYNTSSTTTKDSGLTDSNVGDEKYETFESTTAPAVQEEFISKSHHEEVQPVIDSQRHQDHYHTTVQPLKDTVVEPETHIKQQAETQYREYDHEDATKTKERLAAEQAQFQSSRTEAPTENTMTQNPTIVGEQVHHHLHETIQPVIKRDIHKTTVTHTTVPIQETHHDAPHFHGTTVNPTMSVGEFQAQTSGTTSSTAPTGEYESTGSTSRNV